MIIGSQEWTVENLKTTRYANGDELPGITENVLWKELNTGAWCWYNNNSQLENPYGKLYNCYAATDSRNLCPNGWHIPADAEWDILINYLGGPNIADDLMKEEGFLNWNAPNSDATNASGFTGLPGGYRYTNGEYSYLHNYGYWWSGDEADETTTWCRSLGYNYQAITRGNFSLLSR